MVRVVWGQIHRGPCQRRKECLKMSQFSYFCVLLAVRLPPTWGINLPTPVAASVFWVRTMSHRRRLAVSEGAVSSLPAAYCPAHTLWLGGRRAHSSGIVSQEPRGPRAHQSFIPTQFLTLFKTTAINHVILKLLLDSGF